MIDVLHSEKFKCPICSTEYKARGFHVVIIVDDGSRHISVACQKCAKIDPSLVVIK